MWIREFVSYNFFLHFAFTLNIQFYMIKYEWWLIIVIHMPRDNSGENELDNVLTCMRSVVGKIYKLRLTVSEYFWQPYKGIWNIKFVFFSQKKKRYEVIVICCIICVSTHDGAIYMNFVCLVFRKIWKMIVKGKASVFYFYEYFFLAYIGFIKWTRRKSRK